jgi:hypothetical protein
MGISLHNRSSGQSAAPDRGSAGLWKLAAASAAAILIFAWPQAAHSITVSGTLNVTGRATAPASGPCAATGFTACPDGNCVCVQVPHAAITGSATGSVNLSATIDNGEEDSSAECTPIYASFSATATIPAAGSASVSGDLFLVQCANGALEGGAWDITAASANVGGSGTISGTFDGTKGKVALKLTGTLSLSLDDPSGANE